MQLDTLPVDLPARTDDLTTYLRALGAELRRLRERRHWTRRDLKARLRSDISLQTLATYELGTRQCSVSRLVEICLALGEVPHQLLFRVHQELCASRPGPAPATHLRLDLIALAHDRRPALHPLRRWALTKLAQGTTEITLDEPALRSLAQLCGMPPVELRETLAAPPARPDAG